MALTAALEQIANPGNWLHDEDDPFSLWEWQGPEEEAHLFAQKALGRVK